MGGLLERVESDVCKAEADLHPEMDERGGKTSKKSRETGAWDSERRRRATAGREQLRRLALENSRQVSEVELYRLLAEELPISQRARIFRTHWRHTRLQSLVEDPNGEEANIVKESPTSGLLRESSDTPDNYQDHDSNTDDYAIGDSLSDPLDNDHGHGDVDSTTDDPGSGFRRGNSVLHDRVDVIYAEMTTLGLGITVGEGSGSASHLPPISKERQLSDEDLRGNDDPAAPRIDAPTNELREIDKATPMPLTREFQPIDPDEDEDAFLSPPPKLLGSTPGYWES
ncbi:hypothetical protein F5B20DRAFT_250891 [Whalleya microplaca]|nr:hypothetical protein F5B20DRAFT_250891 [Whalleya microplaca]